MNVNDAHFLQLYCSVVSIQDNTSFACSSWIHCLNMFSCLQKAIIGESIPSNWFVTIIIIVLRSLSLFCFDT